MQESQEVINKNENNTIKNEKNFVINIKQQEPNEKFYKSMKQIQGFTHRFFYDLCEEPDDFLLQIFPVIERIDLYEIVDELKMQDTISEQKRLKRWLKIIKKMNLLVDIAKDMDLVHIQSLQKEFRVYQFYANVLLVAVSETIEFLIEVKQFYLGQINLKQNDIYDVIQVYGYKENHTHQRIQPSINYIDIKRYGITIERKSDEEIDPIIDLTAMQKHYFCNICYIYDCRIHLYERKKGQDYYHPSTFIQNSKQYSLRMLKYLAQTYKQMVFNPKYSFVPTAHDESCGTNCYKLLTKEKIKQIKKKQNNQIEYSDLEKLFIRFGERRFYYNICYISLIQLNFSCDQLFIYIVDNYLQANDQEVFTLIQDQFYKKNIELITQSSANDNSNISSQQILNKQIENKTEKQPFEEDDLWSIDDDDELDNKGNVSIQQSTQQQSDVLNQANLAQKLSMKLEFENQNKNVISYLKDVVINYSQQEEKIKQEQSQNKLIESILRQSEIQMELPQPEESDEDEGQLKENNMSSKEGQFNKEDDDCYGFTNLENQNEKEDIYQHCVHYRHNKHPIDQECKNCGCRKRGFCDQYCMCDPKKCKIYRVGCNCSGSCSKNSCICFKKNIECDPDRVVIANSQICGGMGLFNVYPLQKGDLISIYFGEILGDLDIVIRDSWKPSDLFYIFSLIEDQTVDSKYLGNKSRFMNHSKNKDNSYARMVYARGGYTIGLFSKQNIPPGNELLFDYDGQGTLKNKYEWIKKKVDSKSKQFVDENVIVFEPNKSPQRKIFSKFKKRK